MLHESPHPAACWHVLHLLHILEPYEPNCWQSSEMIPRPGILDDMTPPPRPGIPLQVFWHFPARKEPTRFYHHAENFFKLPPCHSPRQTKNAHRFAFVAQHVPTLPDNGPTADVCSSTEHGPRHPAPCVRIRYGLASPPAIRAFCLGKRLAVKSARRIINAYNHIGRCTNGPRIAS